MDGAPSIKDDAHMLVRNDLYTHLDEAEFLVAGHTSWSRENVLSARKLIPDLITVIRGLLLEHDRGVGPCPLCSSAWPCPVVTTIHRLVKNPGGEFVALVQRTMGQDF